jgi:hypothetical protein
MAKADSAHTFISPSSGQATLCPAAASDVHDRVLSNLNKQRSRVMEIAAVLMCAAVLLGFLLQFDRQTW